MPKRSNQIRTNELSRFMIYLLGHRPDEFGLVPDREGFVSYKELLQAMHEEEGWRHVTRSHINEVLLGENRYLFHAEDTKIRAREKRWQIDLDSPLCLLPNILFTPVRKKAHKVAMERGLKSSGSRYLILSSNKNMAMKIGKRRDQNPVMLEVRAQAAASEGAQFFAFGSLFLGREILPGFIAGPPVPKERKKEKKDIKPEKEGGRKVDFTPGTFTLDTTRDPDRSRGSRAKKPRSWKEEARKIRREKHANPMEP